MKCSCFITETFAHIIVNIAIETLHHLFTVERLPALTTHHFPQHRCRDPRGPGPLSQWCGCAGHHGEHSAGEMAGLYLHLYSTTNIYLRDLRQSRINIKMHLRFQQVFLK